MKKPYKKIRIDKKALNSPITFKTMYQMTASWLGLYLIFSMLAIHFGWSKILSYQPIHIFFIIQISSFWVLGAYLDGKNFLLELWKSKFLCIIASTAITPLFAYLALIFSRHFIHDLTQLNPSYFGTSTKYFTFLFTLLLWGFFPIFLIPITSLLIMIWGFFQMVLLNIKILFISHFYKNKEKTTTDLKILFCVFAFRMLPLGILLIVSIEFFSKPDLSWTKPLDFIITEGFINIEYFTPPKHFNLKNDEYVAYIGGGKLSVAKRDYFGQYTFRVIDEPKQQN